MKTSNLYFVPWNKKNTVGEGVDSIVKARRLAIAHFQKVLVPITRYNGKVVGLVGRNATISVSGGRATTGIGWLWFVEDRKTGKTNIYALKNNGTLGEKIGVM